MTPHLHALEHSEGLPEPALDALSVLPLGDEALRYAIEVPVGWECATDMGECLHVPQVQRPIGAFGVGRPPSGQSMTVTITPMPIEIRVADWVRHVFERADWIVLDQRWHDTKNGPRLVTWGLRERALKATVAFADGGRVLMIHCMGGVSSQPSVATTVWRSALPMHLVRPAGAGRLEARTSVRHGALAFELPRSWQLSGAEPAPTATITDVHRGEPVASVAVRTAGDPSQPHETRTRETLARLWKDGWRPSRDLRDPVESGPDSRPDWEIRDCIVKLPNGMLATLRLAHGQCDGQAIEIVATCETDREFLWMRTARAVEIAIASMSASHQPGRC